MKIIHTADWHLGFVQYLRQKRKRDIYEAAKSILDFNMDVVLLCGDLFHTKKNDWATIESAKYIISTLKDRGVLVVGITGNHCHTQNMTWLEFFGLPTKEEIIFDNLSINRYDWGTSFNDIQEPSYSELYNILMIHDGVAPVGDIDKKAIDRWLDMGYDYIALGHIHYPYVVDNFLFNPGSPEYTSVNLWGNPGGFFVIDVDNDGDMCYNHHITPHRKSERFSVDSSKLSDIQIEEFLMDSCSSEGALYHVDITGERRIQAPFISDLEKLINRSNKPLRLKIVNATGIVLPQEKTPIREKEDLFQKVFGEMADKVKRVVTAPSYEEAVDNL